MRTQLLLIMLATAACRGDVDLDPSRGPAPSPKPVEVTAPPETVTMEGTAPAETTTVERPRMNDAEHEWVNIRSRFEQTSRDRMAKLDARIQELEQSASESAHMTAQELRRDRDELAMRIEQVREVSPST
jgi:uncharacterized protein YdcH (DUF465 family)